MTPILTLKDVLLRRGGGFALSVGELELHPGRLYALTGPNGAGKSTLLRLLAGLEPPDSGALRLDGEVATAGVALRRLRRQATLVEQSPFLFDASVYENLAFGLRLREVGGDLQRRRIARALEAVGLAGFEHRRARALSGGEAQRVALARALVLRPRVLLLDEPTGGLDCEALPLFEAWLSALPAEGVTVVLSTHDAAQPGRLGGETLRLRAGRLETDKNREGGPSSFKPMENEPWPLPLTMRGA